MTTADKLSLFSLILAAIAVGISIFSYKDNQTAARKGFIRNYRPYICSPPNYGYFDTRENVFKQPMNVISIWALNAPASMSVEVQFFERDAAGQEKLIYTQPSAKNELLYPIEKQQFTSGADPNKINREIAVKMQPKKLVRKVKIEYTWIEPDNEKYYLNAECEYSIENSNWQTITQTAN